MREGNFESVLEARDSCALESKATYHISIVCLLSFSARKPLTLMGNTACEIGTLIYGFNFFRLEGLHPEPTAEAYCAFLPKARCRLW